MPAPPIISSGNQVPGAAPLTGSHAIPTVGPITGSHAIPSAGPRTGSHAVPGASRPPERVRFPAAGDVLASPRGAYTVQKVVGHGAQGAVYEAFGPFDQRYALKLQVPANRPYAEVQTQWVRESQRLLRLRHPGVVYMHDAFELDFLFYMALEWCSHSLRDLLRQPLAPDLAVEVTRQILAAVHYLHDNDIVHGDLHPGNVLLTDADRPVVKLADFGISQELHGRGFARPDIVHHAIMAPELINAGYTSRQSDIYQVGLLLYWMVVGTPALDYNVPYPELVRQIADGVPRARAEAIATPLGAVIAKMVRRREAFRYQSAREVWEDLRPTVARGQMVP
jgi:eukaryotic-like serine/threonine-protein kinase